MAERMLEVLGGPGAGIPAEGGSPATVTSVEGGVKESHVEEALTHAAP
jgi:hypothetical protein